MNKGVVPHKAKINKRLICSRITFAINNIPGVDAFTLRKLQELLSTPEGGFGFITLEQLIADMELILKYIPGACGYSLLTLAELIEGSLPPARQEEQRFSLEVNKLIYDSVAAKAGFQFLPRH